MLGLPGRDEAAPYYYKYIDRFQGEDIIRILETQLDETQAFLLGITEEKSLHRYAPEKWSLRQVLSHVNDTERVFLYRALWFARGFDIPLPSFDENVCAEGARADEFPWSRHVEEFQRVRQASLSFFHNLPPEAWMRGGIASDNRVTVRALAYIAAGHVDHHIAIVKERYL